MFPLVLAAIEEINDPKERDVVEKLFEEYANFVYTVAIDIMRDHHDAENIVSDVFLKVIAYRKDFIDASKQKQINLLRIYTRHSCSNVCRRGKLRDRYFIDNHATSIDGDPVDLIDISPDNRVDIAGDYIEAESVKEIKKVIKSLPYPDSDILWLKVFHNYTSERIGKILDMNPSTVRGSLQRARREAIKRLEELGIC